MIEFANEAPHLANGTQWEAKHDGRKIGILTVSKYENVAGGPLWQAKLYDAEDNLIAREEMTHAMPDMDDLAIWAGHTINLLSLIHISEPTRLL